ncbi:MAG: PEP-CTERM sorting domain-containing protein [Bryobacterales bacterium]|nr:PEP-CTERM sorting domain-containing protein [Bryobacterales bacterium]
MFLMAAAVPASATITGGSINSGAAGATFIKLNVPFTQSNPDNTVGNNTFQSIHLYGFDEDQNIVLAAPLTVDVVPSGPLTLPTGTTVASHYIFFDPAGTTSIDGFVNFDSDIVAIITSLNNLTGSDFLANTGVTYLSPGLRGLESGDSVTISGARQIRFDTTASTPGDYVRVLTAYSPSAVPEPGTAALFVAAFGLAALRYRRS